MASVHRADSYQLTSRQRWMRHVYCLQGSLRFFLDDHHHIQCCNGAKIWHNNSTKSKSNIKVKTPKQFHAPFLTMDTIQKLGWIATPTTAHHPIAAEALIAWQRIHPHVDHTPLTPISPPAVHIKREDLQRTGSFKARGACNALLSMTDAQLARGIITSSTGNHALGCLHAFALRTATMVPGCRLDVYVPTTTAPVKLQRLRALGANVIQHGQYDEQYNMAQTCIYTTAQGLRGGGSSCSRSRRCPTCDLPVALQRRPGGRGAGHRRPRAARRPAPGVPGHGVCAGGGRGVDRRRRCRAQDGRPAAGQGDPGGRVPAGRQRCHAPVRVWRDDLWTVVSVAGRWHVGAWWRTRPKKRCRMGLPVRSACVHQRVVTCRYLQTPPA